MPSEVYDYEVVADDKTQQAVSKMLAMSPSEFQEVMKSRAKFKKRLPGLGYPGAAGAASMAPFKERPKAGDKVRAEIYINKRGK